MTWIHNIMESVFVYRGVGCEVTWRIMYIYNIMVPDCKLGLLWSTEFDFFVYRYPSGFGESNDFGKLTLVQTRP